MHSVRFTAETSSDGVVERDFLVGEIPGVLWAPVSGADHAPIVLVGHNGGMHKKAPGLRARALHTAATWGSMSSRSTRRDTATARVRTPTSRPVRRSGKP